MIWLIFCLILHNAHPRLKVNKTYELLQHHRFQIRRLTSAEYRLSGQVQVHLVSRTIEKVVYVQMIVQGCVISCGILSILRNHATLHGYCLLVRTKQLLMTSAMDNRKSHAEVSLFRLIFPEKAKKGWFIKACFNRRGRKRQKSLFWFA